MGFSIASKPSAQSAQKPAQSASSGGKSNPFLKSGAVAKSAMEKAEQEAEARKNQMGAAWRFRISPDEDAHITFLDGALDPVTGILAIQYANEHTIKIGNKPQQFMCIEDVEPCPLCAKGEKREFVGYLTVLDHRGYTDKDNKKHDAVRRLYVAKQGTLKQLTKFAEKRENGLVGVTFEASRTGEKKAAVGDVYQIIGEHSMAEIEEAFGEIAHPLDYDQELGAITFDSAQLAKLGHGSQTQSFGSSGGSTFGSSADDIDDDKPAW